MSTRRALCSTRITRNATLESLAKVAPDPDDRRLAEPRTFATQANPMTRIEVHTVTSETRIRSLFRVGRRGHRDAAMHRLKVGIAEDVEGLGHDRGYRGVGRRRSRLISRILSGGSENQVDGHQGRQSEDQPDEREGPACAPETPYMIDRYRFCSD